MQTVMDALLKSENALLESPTGTGKVNKENRQNHILISSF